MAQLPVLIIGGCGFVGYHIVKHFVEAPEFSPVSVLSRSATTSANRIDGVQYISGDLGDRGSIQRALQQVRPAVIIHAASPSPTTGTAKEYQKIAVDGTNTLLQLARESPDVRVLVYTSSSTMSKGREHLNLDENVPLADMDTKAPAYARTKAKAERTVLQANDPVTGDGNGEEVDWTGHLSTSAIRLPICYGTHDLTTIPGCLQALQKGQTNIQLGDGKNVWNFCSTENVGIAHVLVTRALLAPGVGRKAIGGEAFHIHDGEIRPFWGFARAVWEAAGHKKRNEHVCSIPVWFVSALAAVLEVLFSIFTFGKKRPQLLGKQQVEYACFSHTYSIEKARKLLRYEPRQAFDEEISKAVEWSLKHDGWVEKLKIRSKESAL
ncbi:hypothetical protein BCR34DRAFT_578225 [Clohesyomyces aquaticus]|uniref:3-beta hydroxysteroid dehydrogenase/isomerase domain-containing protein n=1 Tax=Clohesyomyces aquaticus TaxID=1231657 RepID=A0A1Y1YG71_9PLEO|nr:hypothetical protein BCR34DRAFT_578225 [Clohesyomyces aquaticus]